MKEPETPTLIAHRPEQHRAAFLIGKVRDVVPYEPTPENNESPKDRFLIQFSEFERIIVPGVWKGDRNPVKYVPLEGLGIDISVLKWENMPECEDTWRDGLY